MNRFRALPRSRQIIVGIVSAAIIGCCVMAGLGAMLSGDDEPGRSQAVLELTAASQATETPVLPAETAPADTPVPTDTPRPTDTPEPTEPPQPTHTPQPTMTSTPTHTPLPTDMPEPPTPAPTQPPAARVVIAEVYNLSTTEHVKIANQGDAPVDMSGWYVHGSRGDEVYTFPDGYILPAGATMRLHSGDNGVDSPPLDIYWINKPVWNNQGETTYLKDAQGNIVAQYSW